jgi:hypothetical protein
MARPGKSIAKRSEGRAGEKYLPVGGRVRKLRALEDRPGQPLKRETSEIGWNIDKAVLVGHAQWEHPLARPQGRRQKAVDHAARKDSGLLLFARLETHAIVSQGIGRGCSQSTTIGSIWPDPVTVAGSFLCAYFILEGNVIALPATMKTPFPQW